MGMSYEDIKSGAYVFSISADLLGCVSDTGINKEQQKGAKQVLASQFIPAVVMKAFSIELALKALAAKNNKNIEKIHKLHELFNLIDEGDKTLIREKVVDKIKETDVNYDDNKFDTHLIEVTNVFVDWRYFYENPRSINYLFFNSLYEVVKTYVVLDK